ncbi:MAG: GNAT family N-acetyltransferase [Bacteroidota bacterium]
MQNLVFRKATLNDLDELSALAEKIWKKHYITIISQQQIDFMLNWMYSKQALQDQIENQNHQFYVVFKNDVMIAYASFTDKGNGNYFIHKFYVDTDLHQAGVGSQLFSYLKNQMPNLSSIRLTVNRANYTAINFYFKNGFVIEKVEDFDIGNGYFMNDFVMIFISK